MSKAAMPRAAARYTEDVDSTTPSPQLIPAGQHGDRANLGAPEDAPASAECAAVADTYAMPATQGQIRFWSLDQLNPGNPALNMPLMWKFTGPLDQAALAQAFTLCVQRHESLRTTFTLLGGKLMQIIGPARQVSFSVTDLSAQDHDEAWKEADRQARDHAAIRMDLHAGPLLELKLLRLGPESHLLLVTMHHIICDGISNGILLRDMAAFYDELVTGKAAALPDLPVQFADFALWQEEWLAGDAPARSLEFWRRSLGNDFGRISQTRDADALASLPAQRLAWTGDIETQLIPPALQARAHAFCKRENVTLNILLFSIFATLLHRLTGQFDLTIGSPCANRTEDTDELIGLFMNIQVMRLRLGEAETFEQLLRKVQDWTLGAYENQELPFETLVHDRYFADGGNSFEIPIFFLYQKSFMLTHNVGGVEIVPLRSESPGAVFEMMFAIVDRAEEGPRLQLEYNPRYFKPSTIKRYLRMFTSLLDAALTAPADRIDDLCLVEGEDYTQLTETWNQTAVELPPFQSVVAAFLERAAHDPERTALECEGIAWSYAQLAGYAQQLAAHLVTSGVQPGELVGVCVERSPRMLAAVLAVMMAGATYVPLDPRHPTERLQSILADANVAVLIASRALGIATSARLIDLNDGIPDGQLAELPPPAAASDLAYVIYTSGSTGVPKGVAIEHGALINLLASMQREPGLQADDVLLAITTLAFDIAALELFLPLLTGAKLVIATAAEVGNARLLLERMRKAQATLLQATPGAWRLLLDAGWARSADAPPLKALCGGESLPRELAERILNAAGELWNMYGPTETTIWSSATRVQHGEGALRIGPPIANTQFYVLDARRQPCPIGVSGELYIGGAGLARGYWRRDELTAARFIDNPFAATQPAASARLYCTGDLARRHDDGLVELLGRSDFQVKVRGYRIELTEIEAALLAHPQVSEAVVTQSKSDVTGVTRLIAYVTSSTAIQANDPAASDHLIGTLRTQLARTLPDYMMPNAFAVLAEMPRNLNGKINRAALPAVDKSISGVHAVAAEHYYPPTDDIERQLTDIWQTTLGIDRISVRASFFSLGVGSLAALRLITRMNRVYAMDLGLASLISASTIQSIAELIRTRFAPNTNSSIVPLQPNGTRAPLFILHGVGGNVVNFYGLAQRMGNMQPVYGVQSQALLANQPALLHLKDMAAHYLAEIRKLQPHGPYHLLGYSFGGTVALEMAHQLRGAGEEVAMLGMIDSKSKDYQETLDRMRTVQEKINGRMTRFKGNTDALSLRERAAYIFEKVNTRAIRFACMAAARLHFKQVPAFMRSAYDINYVAVQNYKPRPYDGKLVLFRATDQNNPDAPHDLGWGGIFSQPVEIHDLPGDHERIFLEPNIEQLAASLQQALGVA